MADDFAMGIQQMGEMLAEQNEEIIKQRRATAFWAGITAMLLKRLGSTGVDNQQCIPTIDLLALEEENLQIAYGTTHNGDMHLLHLSLPGQALATEQEMIDALRKKQRERDSGLVDIRGKSITH